MSHRHCTRQMLLLLRDALGRFTRVRAILTSKPRAPRKPCRPVVTAVQLALF